MQVVDAEEAAPNEGRAIGCELADVGVLARVVWIARIIAAAAFELRLVDARRHGRTDRTATVHDHEAGAVDLEAVRFFGVGSADDCRPHQRAGGAELGDEDLALAAIQKIENESHTSGLTDRITQFLKEEKEKTGGKKNE